MYDEMKKRKACQEQRDPIPNTIEKNNKKGE